MINRYDIYNIIVILLLSGCIFYMNFTVQRNTYKCEICAEQTVYGERSLLYEDKNYNNVRVNGVYFEPYYFCVWTKDETEEEINNTFCHESCHDFVYKQREHFCGE